MIAPAAGRLLLDTNVVSELMNVGPRRDANVMAWSDSIRVAPLIPSVVHFEVQVGILNIPPGRRRDDTIRRYELFRQLTAGVVDFNEAAAGATAEFMAHRRRQGRRMDDQLADAQICGTAVALARSAGRVSLATRNTGDFARLPSFADVALIDPWAAGDGK